MSERQIVKLKNVVREWSVDTEEDGPLRRIELNHLQEEGTAPLRSWRLKEMPSEERISELVTDVLEHAEADADGIGGVNKYCLCAYFGDDNREPKARSPVFRVSAKSDSFRSGNIERSESPTVKGLLSQMMRHTEALTRLTVGGAEATITSLLERNAVLERNATAVVEQQMRNLELYQNLLDSSAERQLAIKKQEAHEERMDHLMTNVTPLLPILAGKAIGGIEALKKLVQGGVAPAELQSAVAVFSTLTPDEIQKMAVILGQERGMALFELYKTFSSIDDKKDEEKKAS